ncbi:MAG: 50S ribosomal protein L18 [Nitrospinae bacterium]|nr:50S ribosomal protein L18 [Nitrospinota bacterium]
MSLLLRTRLRLARKLRVKNHVQKKQEKPRLSIFRSGNHIYAQIIDDKNRRTLVSESTVSPAFKETSKSGGNVAAAAWVGAALAEKALQNGIQEVYCDRNGFRYTGRVKALADSARAKGLKF